MTSKEIKLISILLNNFNDIVDLINTFFSWKDLLFYKIIIINAKFKVYCSYTFSISSVI